MPRARAASDGAQQRIQVAMRGRDQHRHGGRSRRDVERVFGEAQQEIRAGASAAPQFVGIGGIDADLTAGRLRARAPLSSRWGNGVSGRQPRSMTSAPAARIAAGAREDRVDAERRRIDDLGENAHVVARQIGRRAAPAEKSRQVLQLVGPALERHAEIGGERVEIGAAAAGHDRRGRPAADAAAGGG